MARKTFVLGVGAQKAGTSWLHDQLNQLSFAEFGLAKEYHLFDSLHFPNSRQKDLILDGRRSHWRRLPLLMTQKTNVMKLRRTFACNPTLYFEYFDRLVGWRRPRAHLTGDITPQYGGLSASVLADIRRQLVDRGFKVKLVFIMRDPVERLWSAVRMSRRLSVAENPFLDFDVSEDEAVIKALPNRNVEAHTRYERTLAAVEKSFPADDVYLGLYENLFNEGSWQALCQKLEISAPTPSFDRIVNASPKDEDLTLDTRLAVAKHYKASYTAAVQIFGLHTIERFWPSAALIDLDHSG